MKILILANRISWTKELKKKLDDVSKFFGVIDFTIEKTDFKNYPLSRFIDSNGKPFDSIDETWYDQTISLPAKKLGFDMVCLLIPKADWKLGYVQGYGTPNDNGIEEIVLLANKTGKYDFNGVRLVGDQLTHILIHEIMHRLYSFYKKEDNTHKYYLQGKPELCLNDFKTPLPNYKVAVLTRTSNNQKQTTGTVKCVNGDKRFDCYSLERGSDLRIPVGEYQCEWTFSPKFLKYMYLVKVPNMSGIRIHGGNYWFDTTGCILLGDKFIDMNKDGLLDIVNSKVTMKKFEDFFNRETFTLLVI
jgi:hypothetical protein